MTIDGKKLRDEILATVKLEVAALPFQPVFCDILVGNDPASAQYVRMKERMAESVGISFHPEISGDLAFHDYFVGLVADTLAPAHA